MQNSIVMRGRRVAPGDGEGSAIVLVYSLQGRMMYEVCGISVPSRLDMRDGEWL